MEAAAVIMDAVARMAAARQDNEEQSPFDRALQSLQANESPTFMLREALAGADDRLTIPQAQALANELKKSTSIVTTLVANLKYCSIPAISFCIDYIRTSPVLKELWAGYSPRASDSPEIQQEYQTQLDLVFQAVLQNPNITTMNALSLDGNNPESIYNLLARSTALTEFRSAGRSMTAEMALALAAGICRSRSIDKLVLGVEQGPLDIVVSGIGASSVQSITLWHGQVDAVFCQSISKMLHVTPSLTEVNLADAQSSFDTLQGGLGRILAVDLRYPACAGLKRLHLEDTCLANPSTATHDDDEDDDEDDDDEEEETGNSHNDSVDRIVVATTTAVANKTLERLSLRSVRFPTAEDVRLLWNIIGLQELCVGSPSILVRRRRHVVESFEDDEAEEDEQQQRQEDGGNGNDDDDDEDNILENYWTTFIRRNDKLDKIDLVLGANDSDQTYVQGILHGARSHPSLSTITISCGQPPVVLGGDIGQGLCQVLQETTALKVLSVTGGVGLEPACMTLLAQGISSNHSLHVLHVSNGNEEILQSLVENQTIQELTLDVHQTIPDLTLESSNIHDTRRVAFCQSLCQVFQNNRTLTEVAIAGANLCEGMLAQSLQGLPGNKTLKMLSLDGCAIDTEAMTALGNALESTDIALKELWLPKANTPSVFPVLMTPFLQSIVRMPTIRKIHFGCTLRDPTQDERRLLLRAAIENKKLLILDGCGVAMDDASVAADLVNVQYYLKLNQFGRRILDSTNIITSVWPIILALPATRHEHVSSLFYFVREYFSRQRAEIVVVEPQVQQPPQKRARVV